VKPELCIYDPVHVRVTGDLVSGVMLSRIVFWWTPNKQGKTKLRATFDGQPWLVKSSENWKRECGFTTDEYRYAISKLKAKKFIYTEIHLFKGKTAVFIRLNFKKLGQAIALEQGKSLLREADIPATGAGKIPSPGPGKSLFPSTGELQGNNMGTTLHPLPPSKAKALGGKKVLAKDVLEKFSAKNQGTVAQAMMESVKGPEGFQRSWTLLVPYYHDIGETMVPLTGKQRGMLSHFRKAVGLARAPDVLVWAIREWNKGFGRQVLEEHHRTLPNRPDPAYLLRYAGAALTGWSAGLTQKAVKLTATQPVVTKYVVK
jgi:hypothetical protein